MLFDYNDNLYKSLSDLEIIDQSQLESVFKEANETKKYFGQELLERDLISDENLGKVMADILDLPLARLSNVKVPKEILNIVPEIVAKKQGIMVFKKDVRGLHVGSTDPSNLEAIEFLKKKTGMPITLYFVTKQDFENTLSLYAEDINKAFQKVIEENIKQVRENQAGKVEPPIIKIVDIILEYAYRNRTSDVHIEPAEDNILVRFRIDGVLHDIIKIPKEFHSQIVMRVKILAKLRTDEHHSAQDGRMRVEAAGEDLDLRISIVPIIEGEKVVMRLLSERARHFSLDDLGFSAVNLKKLENAYNKPYGMLLSTGPTGSGKTTTLYAVIKLLNKREVNIMTIEDPVEYDIERINQIQVNPKTNLTFAAGLKSIVRQDPDIILVGEIRDNETASIAINSAMTGHLVLSTMHTNDAATSIPRFIEMGIEPFLAASSINIVIAQRLIRRICLKCRTSKEIELTKISIGQKAKRKMFGDKDKIRVYYGKGCYSCHNTGYEGRLGIFEVLEISDNVRKAIIEKKDASAIRDIAVADGMQTIMEDGLEKVKQGITTIDEILRATKE